VAGPQGALTPFGPTHPASVLPGFLPWTGTPPGSFGLGQNAALCPWQRTFPVPHPGEVALTCPECGSDRIVVLVHSLRALCGACLWQWAPPEAEELELILWGPPTEQN
jgi:hypothetical protein